MLGSECMQPRLLLAFVFVFDLPTLETPHRLRESIVEEAQYLLPDSQVESRFELKT